MHIDHVIVEFVTWIGKYFRIVNINTKPLNRLIKHSTRGRMKPSQRLHLSLFLNRQSPFHFLQCVVFIPLFSFYSFDCDVLFFLQQIFSWYKLWVMFILLFVQSCALVLNKVKLCEKNTTRETSFSGDKSTVCVWFVMDLSHTIEQCTVNLIHQLNQIDHSPLLFYCYIILSFSLSLYLRFVFQLVFFHFVFRLSHSIDKAKTASAMQSDFNEYTP